MHMPGVSVEIIAILVLVLANGLFALAEIAIVSARKGRLHQQAEEGKRNARIAVNVAKNPNEFLATV